MMLDKIKLKQFYGEVEEWQSYWNLFESLIHDDLYMDTKST